MEYTVFHLITFEWFIYIFQHGSTELTKNVTNDFIIEQINEKIIIKSRNQSEYERKHAIKWIETKYDGDYTNCLQHQSIKIRRSKYRWILIEYKKF